MTLSEIMLSITLSKMKLHNNKGIQYTINVMLSMIMMSIITLTVIKKIITNPSGIIPSVIKLKFPYAKCHYTQCFMLQLLCQVSPGMS
jgi:hypothetical protein